MPENPAPDDAAASGGPRRALVLGASGYVGGRLVPRLLEAGYDIRCLARTPQKLEGLPWGRDVEIVKGDLLDRDSLVEAFDGVDVVYHLVHSMGMVQDFAAADRRIARHVSRAAELARAGRIVYLGGLGETSEDTSEHLKSRAEVGEILLDSTVPVTVLRAAVIIGSGSASFEMLRHLVEKLPAMVTPRWVRTRTQPIAIRDVLRYLVGVAGDETDASHVYDIGGPEVMTYLDMMRTYARAAGLPPRVVVQIPVLTPRLSSHWVNLVTPVPFGLAQPLVESLAQEVVVRDGGERIGDVVPGATIPYEEAVKLALGRIRDSGVETSWRDADLVGRSPAEPYPGDPDWTGGTLLRDVQTAVVRAEPRYAFQAVARIGGQRGWPTHSWAWRIRGRMDRMVGGVGLRRGRRDPEQLRVGDALDFWRVEELRQESEGDGEYLLRLRAEMIAPGRAWLEFRIEPREGGACITQRALWAPRGLLGRAYWWALLPFHGLIFPSMVREVARDAEQLAARGGPTRTITSSDVQTGPTSGPAERDAVSGGDGPPARRAG